MIRNASFHCWGNSRQLGYFFFVFQRLLAAMRAISERRFWERLAALAAPPFRPPRRPKATAAGFFPSSEIVSGGMSPAAISTMSLASWLGSRGRRMLERFGMRQLSPASDACQSAQLIRLRHYPGTLLEKLSAFSLSHFGVHSKAPIGASLAETAETPRAGPGLSHVAISVVSTEGPSTSLGAGSVPSGETFSPP
jgi:hypothetical protein